MNGEGARQRMPGKTITPHVVVRCGKRSPSRFSTSSSVRCRRLESKIIYIVSGKSHVCGGGERRMQEGVVQNFVSKWSSKPQWVKRMVNFAPVPHGLGLGTPLVPTRKPVSFPWSREERTPRGICGPPVSMLLHCRRLPRLENFFIETRQNKSAATALIA